MVGLEQLIFSKCLPMKIGTQLAGSKSKGCSFYSIMSCHSCIGFPSRNRKSSGQNSC